MKRDAAVFTIVQNDSWMARRWLTYYEKHFAAEDIYILDHLLIDQPCTDEFKGRCQIQHIKYPFSFDHWWLKDTVCKKQHELLRGYNKVLLAEIDEFITPNLGKYTGLADYVKKFEGDVVKCTGYNVVQMNGEPPLDLESPLLAQRTHWRYHHHFNKPLLSQVQLEWRIGFHSADNYDDRPPDTDLYLVHLKWICLERLLKKNEEQCRRMWQFYDMINNLGYESRILNREQIAEYIDTMGPATPMPESIRQIV